MVDITVVTPFHNVDLDIFKDCFRSMVSQTIGIENVEWIIVLHNCEQQYIEAVREMVKPYPSVLTPELNNDARTPSSPRNYGLSMATGRYVGFLDGDDSYLADCLEVAVRNIKETDSDILCFKREYEMEDSDGLPLGEGFLLDQSVPRLIVSRDNWEAEKTFVSVWGMVTSKIYSNDFLKKNDLRFNEEIRFAEDGAFNLEAYYLARQICYLPQFVGYHYYINSASLVQCVKKDADTLISYAEGFVKIFEIGMKRGLFMNNMIGGLLFHTSRFLEVSDLDIDSKKKIRDMLMPYLRIVKPFDVCEIYTEDDVKLRYDYPWRVIPDVGDSDIWEDSSKKDYPLTFAQLYQKTIMENGGVGIEAIEMDRYYELEGDIDEVRLKKAVYDTLSAHEIYQSRIDGSVMRKSDDGPVVALYYFTDALFKEYRTASYARNLDCRIEAPMQIDIISCVRDYCDHKSANELEGHKYLHIKASHYVYDQNSLCNLFDEISARYDGNESMVSPEKITLFDISDEETDLKGSNKYRQAMDFLGDQYSGRNYASLFKNAGENTIVISKILEDVPADELDKKVRDKKLSTGVFMIGVFEKTLADHTGQKDFSYMLLSDGRDDPDRVATHGVMAKGVYITSSTGDYGEDGPDLSDDKVREEYFSKVAYKAKESIAHNIVDFRELMDRYGEVNSLITINYIGNNKYKHRLRGHELQHRFSAEHAASIRTFSGLTFNIEKVGQSFNLVAMSYAMTKEEIMAFTALFEKNVKTVLEIN